MLNKLDALSYIDYIPSFSCNSGLILEANAYLLPDVLLKHFLGNFCKSLMLILI